MIRSIVPGACLCITQERVNQLSRGDPYQVEAQEHLQPPWERLRRPRMNAKTTPYFLPLLPWCRCTAPSGSP